MHGTKLGLRDGFGGLVELRQAHPDVIFSDLSMPNMSCIRGRGAGWSDRADCYFSKGHYAGGVVYSSFARAALLRLQ